MANTLAYYDTATITAVKSFIVQARCSFAREGVTKKKKFEFSPFRQPDGGEQQREQGRRQHDQVTML